MLKYAVVFRRTQFQVMIVRNELIHTDFKIFVIDLGYLSFLYYLLCVAHQQMRLRDSFLQLINLEELEHLRAVGTTLSNV